MDSFTKSQRLWDSNPPTLSIMHLKRVTSYTLLCHKTIVYYGLIQALTLDYFFIFSDQRVSNIIGSLYYFSPVYYAHVMQDSLGLPYGETVPFSPCYFNKCAPIN